MFDERSEKWMKIYKGYTQVMFWLYIVAAVVLGIGGWADSFWITDSIFLDGLILLVGGVFIAFAHLIVNMLIIQLLNNVQIIREKLEDDVNTMRNVSKDNIHSDKTASTQTQGDTYFSRLENEKTKADGYWVCKKCGTHNSLNARTCKDCGEYK